MDLGIKGRVALVSGGARSLGKADCLALAAEGCKIVVLDLNAEGAAETAKEISSQGGVARGYEADITNRAQLAEAVAKAQSEVGPVDICVNNAGFIYTLGQLKDMQDAEWDMNLQVNLTGTYNVTKAGVAVWAVLLNDPPPAVIDQAPVVALPPTLAPINVIADGLAD
jgi:3-oxoacyl-[acyl-carrier protein] reductase